MARPQNIDAGDSLQTCRFLLLLLLLKWLYSPMRTFSSLMDFSQSSLLKSIWLLPRSHLRFPNCWLFPGWGLQPHAQPPTWRTRSPYLYPLETGLATNILNNQSWAADKGWPSGFGVGRRPNNYEMLHRRRGGVPRLFSRKSVEVMGSRRKGAEEDVRF
jgi:hypothetical protein